MRRWRARRLSRLVAWLLTPVVVWAASLLGGWLGALLAQRRAEEHLGWLVAGAIVGGLVGGVGWVVLLRRAGRARGAPAPSDRGEDEL